MNDDPADRSPTDAERVQLRSAKWRAFMWVTAGCLVIGVAQCALLQIR